ncbi:MAG TPA: M48 family metallopeptidase [Myxococcota bacterium]|nr:M48 family metallopeptidase [Myxococcota bacterium]
MKTRLGRQSDPIRENGGYCGKWGMYCATILLPPSVVEFVVVHELIHVREASHTPAFWTQLERAMPDFEVRKLWLAENRVYYIQV